MESLQKNSRFGEVIESSIEILKGQCHTLYNCPPLGSLVRIGDSVFGVINGINTGSIDPSRGVIARGQNLDTEDQIYEDHPQLEQLMRTIVNISVIGFREGTIVHQYLPPLPPRIHSFIHLCSSNEIREFMTSVDFLVLLLRSNDRVIDDVIAATIKQALPSFEDPRAFLLNAARYISSQLPADVSRVSTIIKRLPMDEWL
ncbi:MAG: hypothetical protein CL885_02250 [Dehalococcoidia bacterium]|jgi:hypothetical protein|nr:hypothetical protein [Dehalococcoidia bacterium]MCH2531233.1 hypothetical protein [Dehalococcoidia bacterium]|tara:strand:+ start:3108 stop:3710 length:603 start_codon:yes stop_codon:yes gene_type:complete